MSELIDEHRAYLSDTHRIDAFRRAIQEAVRPGDVVVDLGAGTGILGLFACEAGAARVYAIEAGPMVEIARQLAVANGFADRIVHVREVSTRAVLPEQADAIVTDQIGHFGFEAGLLEYVGDASARWLKPGGRVVPMRVDLAVAPAEHRDVRAAIDFWRGRAAGFDVSPVYEAACNSGYPSTIDPAALLGAPASIVGLDPAAAVAHHHGRAVLSIDRDGTLDALAGWFHAQLSPSVEMTNAPGRGDRINRRQVLLPLTPSTDVCRGDRLQVSLSMRPADMLLNWSVELTGADGAVRAAFRHSTLRGMLVAHDDLTRTDPGFVPALTPAGRARQSVLALCDGRRSIAEIEDEMQRRHADLLPDDAAVAGFVAEVLSVYAR